MTGQGGKEPNAYGYEHQKRRRQLLPRSIGKPCPMCGLPMLKGQALDLDHSTPLALGGKVGDRMAHASCNRLAGARLGAARRWGVKPVTKPLPTSQEW